MTEDYIRVYDKVITPEFSKQIIKMFEDNPQHHEDVVLEGHRSFKQINLQQHAEWEPYCRALMEIFHQYVRNYMEDCNVTDKMFPERFAFEQFRMKRYMPNGVDEFDDHVDVGNLDSARRFLVFFLYLDDNKGGQTEFPQMGISVPPETGRMLMFPPMWTHLHAGRKPIEKPKYIIGSYLHYV
jgi:thiol-disulfide isomerase/thioredoxin